MQGKRIALLESRLGDSMADLVKKAGGIPVSAPALAEVPDIDPGYIRQMIQDWRAQPAQVAIFQTGVGTRALFAATDQLQLTDTLLDLLANTTVVVRGAKPTAALRARGVRIDRSAESPYTTDQILPLLADLPLQGARAMVQRHGEINQELDAALRQQGAEVIEIPVYRWSLPVDRQPLRDLMSALTRHEIDAVVFTSASQAHNLMRLATEDDREGQLLNDLQHTAIVSIGPVCSKALRQLGIPVSAEANPPKLGPLIELLKGHFLGR